MDDIKNVPGWGLPEDFNDMLNYTSGNYRTSYDEMRDPKGLLRDALDDLAEDMSQAVPENTWSHLNIYLIEAIERVGKSSVILHTSSIYSLLRFPAHKWGKFSNDFMGGTSG